MVDYYDTLVDGIANKWEDAAPLERDAYIALLQSKAVNSVYDIDTETEMLTYPNGREVYLEYGEWGKCDMWVTE